MSATRAPLPPPFRVGTRVRYCGTRRETCDRGTLLAPGMEVTIVESRTGRRGTGRRIDPDDETIVDTTRDGSCVYVSPSGERRLLRASDAREWEVLS